MLKHHGFFVPSSLSLLLPFQRFYGDWRLFKMCYLGDITPLYTRQLEREGSKKSESSISCLNSHFLPFFLTLRRIYVPCIISSIPQSRADNGLSKTWKYPPVLSIESVVPFSARQKKEKKKSFARKRRRRRKITASDARKVLLVTPAPVHLNRLNRRMSSRETGTQVTALSSDPSIIRP